MSRGRRSRQRLITTVLITVPGVLLIASAALAGETTSGGGEAEKAAPASSCERGQALATLGRVKAAEDAYLKDLETAEGLKCAVTALEAARKREEGCAVAKALAGSGQKAKAEAAYVAVVEAEPSSKCAATALADMQEGEKFWEWTGTAAKDVGSVLGFIVLAALLGVGLTLVFLQVQTRIPSWRRHWPARAVLRPSLQVESFEDGALDPKMGPQVAALVRAKVTPSQDSGIDMVNGHSSLGDALKPLGEVSSEAKMAVALASFLAATLPRRRFELGGALQPNGNLGFGISVELKSEERFLSTASFWGKELAASEDEAAAMEELSIPAAGWVDHTLASALGGGGDQLSASAQSWALFKAGEARQDEGSEEKARTLYESALAIDAANIGALANLGVIEWRDGNYEEGAKLLVEALAGLSGGA